MNIQDNTESLEIRYEHLILLNNQERDELYRQANNLGMTTSQLVRHWIGAK